MFIPNTFPASCKLVPATELIRCTHAHIPFCPSHAGVSALIETVTYCSSLVGGEWLGKGLESGRG